MSTFGAFEKGHILINMLTMEMALQQPALICKANEGGRGPYFRFEMLFQIGEENIS